MPADSISLTSSAAVGADVTSLGVPSGSALEVRTKTGCFHGHCGAASAGRNVVRPITNRLAVRKELRQAIGVGASEPGEQQLDRPTVRPGDLAVQSDEKIGTYAHWVSFQAAD